MPNWASMTCSGAAVVGGAAVGATVLVGVVVAAISRSTTVVRATASIRVMIAARSPSEATSPSTDSDPSPVRLITSPLDAVERTGRELHGIVPGHPPTADSGHHEPVHHGEAGRGRSFSSLDRRGQILQHVPRHGCRLSSEGARLPRSRHRRTYAIDVSLDRADPCGGAEFRRSWVAESTESDDARRQHR